MAENVQTKKKIQVRQGQPSSWRKPYQNRKKNQWQFLCDTSQLGRIYYCASDKKFRLHFRIGELQYSY